MGKGKRVKYKRDRSKQGARRLRRSGIHLRSTSLLCKLPIDT